MCMKTTQSGKSKIEVHADFTLAPEGMPVLVTIRNGTEDNYWVEKLPSDWGFAMRFIRHGKFDRRMRWVPSESYDVIVEDNKASCHCVGFERYGYCKHAKVAVMLLEAGAEPR